MSVCDDWWYVEQRDWWGGRSSYKQVLIAPPCESLFDTDEVGRKRKDGRHAC